MVRTFAGARGVGRVGCIAMLTGAAWMTAPACTPGDAPGSARTTSNEPAGCNDGVRNGDEVGVDCGGSCNKCTGDACTSASDCKSGECTETGACAASPDKPCGVGTATPCGEGAQCELDADCTTDVCEAGACAPVGPGTHTDGRRNGGETGIDCGGAIRADKPCPEGQGCKAPEDCEGACLDTGLCGAAGSADGKKNGTETDVDCGGGTAPKCASGKACGVDDDCAEAYCPVAQHVCVTPRNDDGVKNGTETDVDCGGQSGKKCAEGLVCDADGDCTGACNYQKKCVDIPSCKPHFGGDTCGAGEVGSGEESHVAGAASAAGHESCCRTLPVTGYTAPNQPGKTVYLDKYEITAGRMRAFVEDMKARYAGNVKNWLKANRPPIWVASASSATDWDQFLPEGDEAQTIAVPRDPTSSAEPQPWNRNVGLFYQFNGQLFVYAHGHNCFQGGDPGKTVANANSYGYPTYFLPPDVMAKNGGFARAQTYAAGDVMIPIQEALDVKSMTCAPNAMLAAFCHWDGGQLATDEVLDYITGSTNGFTNACNGARCPPLNQSIYSGDGSQVSTAPSGFPYYYPYYDDAVSTHEGTSRIGAPGRASGDAARLTAGAEPWMDIRGNLNEVVLDMTGATFTGQFGLKYQGIGASSARAAGNTGKFTLPEYKAGMSGARCMRFR